DIANIKVLCDAYLRNYPDSENAEQVATLAGEVLVQSGNWAEVGLFYQDLQAKFPQSQNIDRYVFFQGVSMFQDGKYPEAASTFTKFLKDYPNSELVENGMYYVAMTYFLTNNYKETLRACKEYLSRFPDGRFAGDMRYRLAFIDFNDKEVDQSDKIIGDLTKFLADHPNDASAGSMLCLIGDTYKKKKSDKKDEIARFDKQALDAYKKAIWTDSPDDVIQYALDTATSLMQANKDWAGIAALHGEFLQRKPESQLSLFSASWVAKMKTREGKGPEAAEMLANALKSRITDASSEQVEFLIDELVRTLIPRKKPADIDADAVDNQLVEILNKAIGDGQNPTANARIYYARARLAQMLRRSDKSDLYLKGIATINAKDPSVLSPALLSVSGEILLKLGNLDEAEGMFQRLIDRYKDGM
ncbi:MAG: tetratricopeptide repeat protein, partial [Verrucomicrobiaceae bacterium]